MKRLHLLLIIGIILAQATLCRAADDGYTYPFSGPYEATILGTPELYRPVLPKDVPFKRLTLEMFPDSQKPDIFFYDKGLRCTVALQKEKAPLIFFIPGTGANDRSPLVMSLMKQFYQAGYHVAAIPNPTHPNFIISGSRSHVPGDMIEDAADIYAALEKILAQVKGEVEVTDISLSGYSLGGTLAPFVAKRDDQLKVFNFHKVLMINPAVSLYTSLTNIEGLLDKIPGGPRKIGTFFNKIMAKFTELYAQGHFTGFNDQFLYAAYKDQLLNKDEAGGIIALAFRINSAGMIFTSDVMTNGGYIVPKNLVLESDDPLDGYFRVGVHLSFFQYFDEYFYPWFKKKIPGITKEALIREESLQSIEGYLASTRKIGVMTNANDFILSPQDLEFLRTTFGDRAQVYPRGGHLGNAEYRDNMTWMVNFINSGGGDK